jgi:hypothetical protein
VQLADVNVLVHAFRQDSPGHQPCRRWLDGVVRAREAFAYSDLVLSGVVRVTTHPRVFNPPTPLPEALAFAASIRAQPHAVPVVPGARHWEIFTGLCRQAQARGNLVPDAYLAALAVESGSEWVTTDRDFDRFPGLRVHHPDG